MCVAKLETDNDKPEIKLIIYCSFIVWISYYHISFRFLKHELIVHAENEGTQFTW